MDEGYIHTNLVLQGTSLKLSDFNSTGYDYSKKNEFTDDDKEAFYTRKQKTVLINEERRVPFRFIAIPEPNKHAEKVFIREASEVINNWPLEELLELSIVILINNSPCLACREELEHFLTGFKDLEKISLILRVGRLYCKHSTPDEEERRLAHWKSYLEMLGIRVQLEAINAVEELPTVQMTSKQTKIRKEMDDQIRKHIESIKYGTTAVKILMKNHSENEKIKYLLPGSKEQMVFGKLMVTAITRQEKTKETKVIPLSKRILNENGKFSEETLEKELKGAIAESWALIGKCLLLICTHVPSVTCQEYIAQFLTENKPPIDNKGTHCNKLIMYIANVPTTQTTPSREEFMRWIKSLETQFIDVCLHPLYAPLPTLTGPIVQKYMMLRDEFENLKAELSAYCMPPMYKRKPQAERDVHTPLTPSPKSPSKHSDESILSDTPSTPISVQEPSRDYSVISISSDEPSSSNSEEEL